LLKINCFWGNPSADEINITIGTIVLRFVPSESDYKKNSHYNIYTIIYTDQLHNLGAKPYKLIAY